MIISVAGGELEVGKRWAPTGTLWLKDMPYSIDQPCFVVREATRDEFLRQLADEEGQAAADLEALRLFYRGPCRFYDIISD